MRVRTAFSLGVLAALVGGAVVAVVVILAGVVDVAATRTSGTVDRVLAYASTRSIAHHSRAERNPLAGDAGAVKRGLEHYRDDCLACHGGPGAHPAEFAAGLHPRPPDLASREVQSFTDGMLYATVADGINSTGMPAFGRVHSSEEIWSIVAFLRHLPALSPEERQELGREAEPSAAARVRSSVPAQSESSAATPGPGQNVHTVRITAFKYVPEALNVHAGDVVEWKNEDFVAHTATADDGTFDTGRIDGSGSKRIVVARRGRFPYSCRYHPSMKGTLVVE